VRAGLVVFLTVLGSAQVAAEPITLRVATVAPEGSSWAREGQAFARDVERQTDGRVKVKLYFGGIAGDEVQTLEQVRRGRIDGIASGGMTCLQLAPSLRVLRIPEMFVSPAEASYVTNHLRAVIDEEFLKSGFVNMGEPTIGPDMIFSREPIRSMADLRRYTFWIWDLDSVLAATLPAMGIRSLQLGLPEALHAFEAGNTQGFIAVPTAALAFQWSTEARYLLDVQLGVLRGCVVFATRAFDRLAKDDQEILRGAGAKAVARLDDVGRAATEALVSSLFQKQGVTVVTASETFRSELLAAARSARDQLPESVVPQALVQRVLSLLADYRAERR
jgi:TRAP-type C4-dicarboxylate transport system substrate-binding protein